LEPFNSPNIFNLTLSLSISAVKENGDLANRQKIVCPKMRKNRFFPKGQQQQTPF
jgi:hypothetical protein